MMICIQRAATGGNAVMETILNGLVREAQNQRRVGAYGNPSVINGMHMMVCNMRGCIIYIKPGGTAEVRSFCPCKIQG